MAKKKSNGKGSGMKAGSGSGKKTKSVSGGKPKDCDCDPKSPACISRQSGKKGSRCRRICPHAGYVKHVK